MLASTTERHIIELLRQTQGHAITSVKMVPVGGGSINHTYRVDTNTNERFFCKINSLSKFPGLFESEKNGLKLLQEQRKIRIPKVIALSQIDDVQLLIMEWIVQGAKQKHFWTRFGEQLADLHMVHSDQFGLDADNYMGALSQSNKRHKDWSQFFIYERIEPQLKLAADGHLLSAQQARQFEKLYIKLHTIFPFTLPTLLHGDLWSGNFLCDKDGQPVLIDPAIYYGHPAMDLAMTTLFGGFEQEFYDAYKRYKGISPNFREEWEVCNLYPLLIHLNLFGESYRPQILHTISRYQ